MSKLNLEVRLEIDTESRTMRMVDQHVLDSQAMPSPRVTRAERLLIGLPKCAWPPCGNLAKLRHDGGVAKYCGRKCYGLARRGPNFDEAVRLPARERKPKPLDIEAVPADQIRLIETAVPLPTASYRSFTFPQL